MKRGNNEGVVVAFFNSYLSQSESVNGRNYIAKLSPQAQVLLALGLWK